MLKDGKLISGLIAFIIVIFGILSGLSYTQGRALSEANRNSLQYQGYAEPNALPIDTNVFNFDSSAILVKLDELTNDLSQLSENSVEYLLKSQEYQSILDKFENEEDREEIGEKIEQFYEKKNYLKEYLNDMLANKYPDEVAEFQVGEETVYENEQEILYLETIKSDLIKIASRPKTLKALGFTEKGIAMKLEEAKNDEEMFASQYKEDYEDNVKSLDEILKEEEEDGNVKDSYYDAFDEPDAELDEETKAEALNILSQEADEEKEIKAIIIEDLQDFEKKYKNELYGHIVVLLNRLHLTPEQIMTLYAEPTYTPGRAKEHFEHVGKEREILEQMENNQENSY